MVVLVLSSVLIAQERQAIDIAALGPQVGDQVPDFSLPDQFGEIQTLQSIMGEQGAMIVFHRSANW
tara:strand:+ start:4083 stop:4280 length:198 start_codon:yes stop_codon:yes gene_type:complete